MPAATFLVVVIVAILTSKFVKIPNRYLVIVILFFIYHLIQIFSNGGSFIQQFIINVLYFMMECSILSLNIKDKYGFVFFVSRATSIIVFVSLIAWIVFLAGVSLPHTYEIDYDDGYHSYINYYFFLKKDSIDDSILPRFFSVFKEPGQLGSICVLLILANLSIVKSKFDTIVLSIALFFSFSLAGWCTIIIALVLRVFLVGGNKRNMAIFLAVFIIVILYIAINNEDSVINNYILDRLVYDESEGIVGNNRTDFNFESHFKSFIVSEDALFGIHARLMDTVDWTYGCAGWKVFIVHNGIIGFCLVLVLLYLVYIKNKSRTALIFMCTYIILCCIRAYFMNPYWIYIYLTVMPLFDKIDDLKKT